jgi:flagellar biosynthesis protein FlhB
MGFFGDNQGRTEKATPKRRKESRQKGQIPRSPNLPFAVTFLTVVILLGTTGPSFFHDAADLMRYMLANAAPRDFSVEGIHFFLIQTGLKMGKLVITFMILGIVISVASNAAQGGLVLSADKLKFHFANLNPVSGLKRLMPQTSVTELLKNLFTLAVVCYFAHSLYVGIRVDLPGLMLKSPSQIGVVMGEIIYRLCFKCASCLVVIAIAEYFWSKHNIEESIKMTKEEVKDEGKNAEGNPEIKSRLKRKQRQMAMRFIMATVPKADVVITNPTHFAVALSYNKEAMAAPTVVAKGQDYMALRIRAIAEENGVPLVENRPLAQALFKTVQIGEPIPSTLFKAVAEVLAYVYKAKNLRL